MAETIVDLDFLEVNLIPCPLCGGYAQCYTDDDASLYIKCSNCGCRTTWTTSHEKEDVVFTAWNNGLVLFKGESIAEVLALRSIERELRVLNVLLMAHSNAGSEGKNV